MPASMSGTIRKRGANAWQVRISLGQRDPETGRWRYIQRRVRVTKRNAQRALDALSVEVGKAAPNHWPAHGHRSARRLGTAPGSPGAEPSPRSSATAAQSTPADRARAGRPD